MEPKMRLTILTAAVLSLIYLVLTARVVAARLKGKVMLGDGAPASSGQPSDLLKAIRAHGNFAEYVPLALILLAALEAVHAPHLLCRALAAMLVLGRVLHPIGMAMPAPNAFRAGGAMLTWVMIAVASLTALVLVL
jgi:uncharacterized membrane protein YecN with MAPEG domain